MAHPLAIDLFCGLGGWTEGLLAEGYFVVGFDIERHEYGEAKYPAELVLQSVLTLHGKQFKDAALIVASPPCQAYSYRAMPWSRAKALPPPDNSLFDACFRIQREACEAAGRHIPLIVENVRGAQKWVGRARWNFGSFYLWGDVPALMPMVKKHIKVDGFRFDGSGRSFQTASVNEVFTSGLSENWEQGQSKDRTVNNVSESPPVKAGEHGRKNTGGSWFAIGSPGQKEVGRNPVHEHIKTVAHVNKRDGHSHTRHLTNQAEHDAKPVCGLVSRPENQSVTCFAPKEGVKQAGISGPRDNGKGDKWFQDGAAQHGSKSNARKAASAAIAKIPFVLARHIARTFKPA